MIDFIKFDIYGLYINDVLSNEHLDFEGRFWERSGEVNPKMKEANYKELKFQIVDEKYLRVSGSIHKYWKGNNYSDFSFEELRESINDLTAKFSFDPCNTAIRNIEFGVNIIMDKNPNGFLDSLINHKGTPFARMRSKNRPVGYDAEKQQYTVKVYNKGLQCELDYFLMRYEIKVVRMEWLKATGISTLADLTNKPKLIKLKKILSDAWDEILATDLSIQRLPLPGKEIELFTNGSNPKYWQRLRKANPKQHDYYRRKFIKMINTYGKNEQGSLQIMIEKKYENLLNGKTQKLAKLTDISAQRISQINHSSGMVKQVNLANPDVKVCAYCQKHFKGRRSVAEYCSEDCRIKAKNRRRDVKRPLLRSRNRYENTTVLFDPDNYLLLTPEQTKISTMYEIFT